MSDEKDIIDKLKRGDKEILNVVYSEYRGKFTGWASKQFNVNNEMATEIYQETVVTLYENIHKGKLTELTTTLQAYLFGIGRNKLMEMTRRNDKVKPINETIEIEDVVEESDKEEQEAAFDAIYAALKEMGNPCKKLLQYFYFEKKSMDEIAEIMDYKNMSTAKNQKYKCFKRLKSIAFKSNTI